MIWQHSCQCIWCLKKKSLLKRLDMNPVVHQNTAVTGQNWSEKLTALAGTACWKGKCWNKEYCLQDWDSRGRTIQWILKDELDASLMSSLGSHTNNGHTEITDPNKLLPQYQMLLIVDWAELGEGPLANKQVWILRTETTILEKETVNETGVSWGWTD